MKYTVSATTARIFEAIDMPGGLYADPACLEHLGIAYVKQRLQDLGKSGYVEFTTRPTTKRSNARWYRLTERGRAALAEHMVVAAKAPLQDHQTCSGKGCGVALVCQRSAAGYAAAESLPRLCMQGSTAHFMADMPRPCLTSPSDVLDWPVPIRVFKAPGEWEGGPISTAPASVWDLGFRAAAEQST